MSNFIKKYTISMFVLAEIIGVGMIAPIVTGVVPSDSVFLLVAAFSASLAGVILAAIVSGKGAAGVVWQVAHLAKPSFFFPTAASHDFVRNRRYG